MMNINVRDFFHLLRCGVWWGARARTRRAHTNSEYDSSLGAHVRHIYTSRARRNFFSRNLHFLVWKFKFVLQIRSKKTPTALLQAASSSKIEKFYARLYTTKLTRNTFHQVEESRRSAKCRACLLELDKIKKREIAENLYSSGPGAEKGMGKSKFDDHIALAEALALLAEDPELATVHIFSSSPPIPGGSIACDHMTTTRIVVRALSYAWF